ncbi:sigma-70 family RNA polymerase sigma factor [Pseudoflavitalea sp. G-6-1-2]|uniref:sigma-70 family RNA polymerase sigma factor n=1 Tax=Pseudoflavitalea sp. G-6-1-2 TaxID=2728841 RepID=UPI00146A801C|nr:sigma-70 family RNA polymerase sigma factor [Pseudoflavitalea sp. G-6-1-2]NML20806.1 sigma-70 family RNA polymerase sigma factor [Pseudoflavitalea sp. G-6-1-2]
MRAVTQQQVKDTELEQFDRLYHQYHQAVYANVIKMVADAAMAEDILQDVFLALWENRHQLDVQNAGGWLFVVSYNKSMTCLKKKLKESSLFIPDILFSQEIASENSEDEQLFLLRLSVVEEAIDHLPARKKEVFRLCRFQGKSHDEVADLMGISVFSVKDYLKQSTQFIRKYISSRHANLELPGTYFLLLYFSQQL